jgi:hypothetical protein
VSADDVPVAAAERAQPGSAAHLALSAAEQAWLLDGHSGPARDRIAYGILTWTAIPNPDHSQAPC